MLIESRPLAGLMAHRSCIRNGRISFFSTGKFPRVRSQKLFLKVSTSIVMRDLRISASFPFTCEGFDLDSFRPLVLFQISLR